jgi:hypothetical protein
MTSVWRPVVGDVSLLSELSMLGRARAVNLAPRD